MLENIGAKTKIISNSENTKSNLFATIGPENAPGIVLSGHTDVVPPGNISEWKVNPFKPAVKNIKLYGRGANDMKASIACFVAAVSKFKSENKKFKGSISFFITGDEEGIAINGFFSSQN